jgi:hypothetical protein
MLNAYAVNEGSKVFVDMTTTNSHLSDMKAILKGNESRFINAQGRTVVKRANSQTILC